MNDTILTGLLILGGFAFLFALVEIAMALTLPELKDDEDEEDYIREFFD